MTQVEVFEFNPFQENTYILHDQTHECIIIDPGCHTATEQQQLSDFISRKRLRPVQLINTHCHIDHVLGNRYVADTYQIELAIHKNELPLLEAVPRQAQMFGMGNIESSPAPTRFLTEKDTITFGESSLKILFTPGHSPGSISFWHENNGFVIAGDVLFRLSIGRTDLPGGDFDTLIQSIQTQLLPLDDATKVYSGHGPATTIGFERRNNPFLQMQAW